MELPRYGDYRYTLHLDPAQGAPVTGYVLQVHHPEGQPKAQTLARRCNLRDTYRDKQDAYAAALKIVKAASEGEFHAISVRLKETFRGYELVGSCGFRHDVHKWQPTLEIISRRPENKGATQGFGDLQSPFDRNLYPHPEHAARFALEYGERMIVGLVSGLKI